MAYNLGRFVIYIPLLLNLAVFFFFCSGGEIIWTSAWFFHMYIYTDILGKSILITFRGLYHKL